MIYYSTGKSPYLPSRGKTVETSNVSVVNELVKTGSIVENIEELSLVEPKLEDVVTDITDVKTEVQKRKGNPNWQKKQ